MSNAYNNKKQESDPKQSNSRLKKSRSHVNKKEFLSNNNSSNRVLKVYSRNQPQYENLNIVESQTGDSIYTPEFEERLGGQIFVSEDKIRSVVNEELDRRFGPWINKTTRNE